MSVSGPLFAVLTPFGDGGAVDYAALGGLLMFLEGKCVRNIVTNGTTAEFPSLSLDERRGILRFCREHFSGTIVNNVSACALEDAQALLAGSVTGAGCAFPEYVVGISDAFASGDLETARRLQEEFDRWTAFRRGLAAGEIPVTKKALSLRLDSFPDAVRPPFAAMPAAEADRVSAAVEETVERG
jgi:dihydrodipicolinate synthase/N-acetylneuraminate lyase